MVTSQQRLGDWRLVAPLGVGGMGSIWRAEHIGSDGPAPVAAIKVMDDELPSMEAAIRFRTEAQTLLKLKHPHVVRAYDYGRTDNDGLYMVLELLEGESLEKRIRREGRLPIADAIEFARAAAEGLAAAHDVGIIHRDVKPANIFACSDGSTKVLDFGLALWMADAKQQPRVTGQGRIMGTPSYMAPEQVMGLRDEDVRTDVWGLGASLYELICGRTPFEADGSRVAEFLRVLSDPPHPMSDSIPHDVRELILRALAKEPDDRFANITDMLAAFPEKLPPSSRDIRATDPAPAPDTLSDEVRLVAVVIANDVPRRAMPSFMEAISAEGGEGYGVRGHLAVGVFGRREWLGDEVARAASAALQARRVVDVGIGTGKALRSAAGGGVTGLVVDAALEAKSLAAVHTASSEHVIGACDETRRQLRGAFEFRGAELLAPLAERSLTSLGGRGDQLPLVGRDMELQQLIDAVEAARDQRKAKRLLLEGPTGSGKSRLLRELQIWLSEHNITQLHARGAYVRTDSSLGMLRELLRSAVPLGEGVELTEAQHAVELLVEQAHVPGDRKRSTLDFLGELLGAPFPNNERLNTARADPRVMWNAIVIALGDLLTSWCTRSPRVLLLDDVQWADAASLELFGTLAPRLEDQPLVIIASARPAGFHRCPPWLTSGKRIVLRELGPQATAQIVEAVLGRAEPAIVERAGGNPYFAKELALSVRDGADPSSLPLNVEAAVQTRLDRLPASQRNVLKLASVLGRYFWAEAVQTLGQANAEVLLGELRARGLVVPRPQSRLAGCSEWAFRHGVVYEACGEMLTEAAKRELHGAAAKWLSKQPGAPPEQLAWHYEWAERPGPALRHWMDAAGEAERRGDFRGVVQISERVLKAVRDDAVDVRIGVDDEYALRLRRATAFDLLGKANDFEAEIDAMHALEALGANIATAARAGMRSLLARLLAKGDAKRALPVAREAIGLADKACDTALQVESRCDGAKLAARTGALDEAAKMAAEALELAGTRRDEMEAHGALAMVAKYRGHTVEAVEAWQQARDDALAAGVDEGVVTYSNNLGYALCALGDYDGARKLLEHARALAARLALPTHYGYALHNLGVVLARCGDAEGGMHAEKMALGIARNHGNSRLIAGAKLYMAFIANGNGEPHQALSHANAAVAEADALGLKVLSTSAHVQRGCALVMLARYPEALAACDAALAGQSETGGMAEWEVELHLARHDALMAMGRADEATAAVRAAREVFDTERARIDDARLRSSFTDNIPAHRRLRQLLGWRKPS